MVPLFRVKVDPEMLLILTRDNLELHLIVDVSRLFLVGWVGEGSENWYGLSYFW